jgi:hypothetical protein
MKHQHRYTDIQKQKLYDFVKYEVSRKTPFKRIFRGVKDRFPWYAAKSIAGFQLYWKYLKEEFLTYGSPDADKAYERHEKTIKLNKKTKKIVAKTFGKVKKLKVVVERFGGLPKKKYRGYKVVSMQNPCSEIQLAPASLAAFSQNSACTVMHHQKLEEFVKLITDVANRALNELPVVMVSALKISHKDNAKFEKIKGIIAETAGCLDKLDDLVKCLERLREVLGLPPAQHP